MVSVSKYIQNVNSVYDKKPQYKNGCDGFDYSDCIGMVKRALKMAGETPTGLSGTNYAARYTIKNFKKIASVDDLKVGDVVIKGRPYSKTDNYPLPVKYLPGGSAYNGDTTNYYHIGTVTQINPLVITHMTSPTAKKDTKLSPGGGKGQWTHYGQLPQVDYGKHNESDKVVIVVQYAKVIGGSLNMRKESDIKTDKITSIPSGSTIAVIEKGSVWCKAVYNSYTGYVMTKYLEFESESQDDKITISLSRDCAKAMYEALKLSLNL